MIEYVDRSTLNMTNLNTVYKGKHRSRLFHIVQDDFATTVTTKSKPGLKQNVNQTFKRLAGTM